MLHVQITLIVWIIYGVLQVTLGSESDVILNTGLAIVGHLEKPSTSKQAVYPPEFLNCCPTCPAKPSSEETSIDVFVSIFKKAVKASIDLSKLFGFFSQISSKEFSDGKYQEILKILINIGAPNPKFTSQLAVKAIVESFDLLNSDIVIQVYAKSIAHYLFLQGILTIQNSVQLGKRYSQMMEEAARTNHSQYAILLKVSLNFLDCLGLFSSDKALLIALLFENEWKLAAKQ